MSKSKIQVETDNSNWQAPKKRKPRKPMKRISRTKNRKKTTQSGAIDQIKFLSEISETQMVTISKLGKKDLENYQNFLCNDHDKDLTSEEQLSTITGRAFGACLNWFNQNTNSKKQKKYVLNFMNKNGQKSEAKILKSLPDYYFTPLGSICRLHDLGAQVGYKPWRDKRIDEIMEVALNTKEDTPDKKPKKKVDVQAATKAMVEKYINMFEDELYKQLDKDEWKPNVFKKMFNDLNIKKRPMNKIRAYFKDRCDVPMVKLDDDMVEVIDSYLEDL